MGLLNTFLGIVGLVFSLWAFYLAYISFANPIIRFNKYLKKTTGWEKFIGTEASIYFYRYKKYPSFQISIDWDRSVIENFYEEWMDTVFIADKDNNLSYFLKLEVNGMLLDKELFVSLDGHRYFVPVPKTMMFEDKRVFYYNGRQIYLSKILGLFHFDNLGEDIYKFAEEHGISINMGL